MIGIIFFLLADAVTILKEIILKIFLIVLTQVLMY